MKLYLVLLLTALSAVHWSHGQDVVEEEIVVGHVQPLGGWSVVNSNREDVKKVVQKAVKAFNKKSKAKKVFKLVEITSAQTKVTNIINYNISAIIGKTMCPKPEPQDLDSCVMAKKRLRCKFDVEYDPRNEEYSVDTSCYKKKQT